MNKNGICIVIPIYKESLNLFEIQSVKQCIEVLSDYTIHFVCSKTLNIDFYKGKFISIEHFTFFESKYFESIEGYNMLMLSPIFYKAFADFNYMLVYQTDCYVFKDELLNWANKGFDYIGGIWFDNYLGDPKNGAKIWYAGNGGLSLRKINKIISVLTSKKPIKNFKQLVRERFGANSTEKQNLVKWLIVFPLKLLGYKNNLSYLSKTYRENEDVFFMELGLIYKEINTPKVFEAVGFSWDREPKFIFDKTGNLPFGCHAWFRQ